MSRRGKENTSLIWAEGGKKKRGQLGRVVHKQRESGLNSDQLFKAGACSRAAAALIKDTVSEQPSDARDVFQRKEREGKKGIKANNQRLTACYSL